MIFAILLILLCGTAYADTLSIQGSIQSITLNGTQIWPVSGGPTPVCVPLPPETRMLPCPMGQAGQIVEQRVSTCPGPAWGPWGQISNTCQANTGPIIGQGSESDPIVLNQPLGNGFYGFEVQVQSGAVIPQGQTVWFRMDPKLIPSSPVFLTFWLTEYDPYQTNISGAIYRVNRATGAKTLYTSLQPGSESQFYYPGMPYNPAYYYLVSVTERGTRSQQVSIKWR